MNQRKRVWSLLLAVLLLLSACQKSDPAPKEDTAPEKQQEEQSAKKAAPRAPRENSSQERGSGLTQPQTKQTSEERKPSVKSKLAALEYASKGQSHPERTHIKTR